MADMHLWARINGKDYPIVYGANFKDNYSETLDSGSIILPHVASGDILESAKPSDDVIVHSESWSVISAKKRFHSVYVPASGEFYRHMLIGTINSVKIFMSDGTDPDNYDYTITLVSETQGLENCLMPNRTITQPQVTEDGSLGTGKASSKSVYFWAQHYVERYGGYVKITENGSTWNYVNRYVLADAVTLKNDIKDKFDSILCPEFSINAGTLRQALTQLFSVADCIPVVHDGVIGYLDLSARVGNGIEKNAIPGKSWESFSMNGGEYADRVRKNYSQALSKDATTTYIENIGFRNSSVASMGFADLKLEFKHPIYSIKKLYMCYYKKQSNGDVVLIKQNITPLIVLESKRNLLSVDWPTFNATTKYTVDDFAKYKFCTLGYSIGSKEISGFGSYLEYTENGLFNTKKTYLENIIEIMDAMYPWGEGFGAGEYIKNNEIYVESLLLPNATLESLKFPSMVSPVGDVDWIKTALVDKLGIMSEASTQQKSVFFKCEYEGFIESSVVYSKDYHDGWVSKIDSPSGSLQIIETEGSATKEKVNKLGNKTLITKARISYGETDTLNRNNTSGTPESALVELGEYSKGFDNEDFNDLIVYIRDISYDIGGINIVYYQCKDYVLKNFYTSVFAKIRPFALASYEESVKRDENRTIEILFSKDKFYYQGFSKQFSFSNLSKIISFSNQDSVSSYLQYYSPIETKYSYTVLLKSDDSESSRYLVENQKFVSGNALCFVVEMVDNVSAGTYIKQYAPNFSEYLENYIKGIVSNAYARYGTDKKALNDVMGTVQDWNMLVGNNDEILAGVELADSMSPGFTTIDQFENAVGTSVSLAFEKTKLDYYKNKGYTLKSSYYGTKIILGVTKYEYIYFVINNDSGFGDPETGYIPKIGFQIDPSNGTHDDKYDSTFDDPSTEDTVKNKIFPYYLMNMPLESKELIENQFGDSNSLYCIEDKKDGKEILNETFEIEPVSDTSDIRFSPYMMKLSSLYGKYRKCWTSETAGYPNLDAFIAVSSSCDWVEEINTGTVLYENYRENPLFCLLIANGVSFSESNLAKMQNMINGKGISFAWNETTHAGDLWSITDSWVNAQGPNKGVYMVLNSLNSISEEKINVSISFAVMDIGVSPTESDYVAKSIDIPYDSSYASPTGYKIFPLKIFGLVQGSERFDANNGVSYGSNPKEADFWESVKDFFSNASANKQYSMKIPQGCGFSFVSPDVSTIRTLFAFVSPEKMTMQNENQLDFVSIPSTIVDVSDTFSINGKTKTILISDAASKNFNVFSGSYAHKLSLTFSTNGFGKGSIRFYYYDSTGDKRYHFVYGQNFESTDSVTTVTAYVSVMDDRSRTVFDNVGDPVYKIVNYADGSTTVSLGNYCVAK